MDFRGLAQGPAPGMGLAGLTRALTRFSHRLTGQAHEGPAITSLRLLAVLNVL